MSKFEDLCTNVKNILTEQGAPPGMIDPRGMEGMEPNPAAQQPIAPSPPKALPAEGKIYLVDIARLALIHEPTSEELQRFSELDVTQQTADQIATEIVSIVQPPEPTGQPQIQR